MRYLATCEGAEHDVEIEELTAAQSLRVKFGGHQFAVDVRRAGPSSFSLLVGDRAFDFDVVRQGDEMIVAGRGAASRVTLLDPARRQRGAAARGQASGKAELKAMMPGRVINLLVKVGDDVTANQGVLVLEAMKMENELKAPKQGKIAEIKVAAGQTVEKGQLLVIIE